MTQEEMLLITTPISTSGKQGTGLWGKQLKILMKPYKLKKKTHFYVPPKNPTLIFALTRFVNRSVVKHCWAYFREHGNEAEECGGISLPD